MTIDSAKYLQMNIAKEGLALLIVSWMQSAPQAKVAR